MSRLALGGAVSRRTALYVIALVVVAGGAVAARVASGADASDTPAPRVVHAMPSGRPG